MEPWWAVQRVLPRYLPDDVVITGTKQAYFVSGIYYFTKTLRITRGTTVVVGTGATPGCVDSDSTAAFYAEVSPGVYPNKNQLDGASGVGGTFVFGENGRFVIDGTIAGSAVNFTMNRRVQQVGKPEEVMNDVSIVSVNGVAGATTGTLDIPHAAERSRKQGARSYARAANARLCASLLVST